MADEDTAGEYVVWDTVLERVVAGPTDKQTAEAIKRSCAHHATVRKA